MNVSVRERLKRLPGARPSVRLFRRVPWEYKFYSWYQWSTAPAPEGDALLAGCGLNLRIGDERDIPRMASERMFRDVSEYSRWLQEGRRLLVAETEGRIVAYLFLQFNGTCVTEQVPERPLVMAKDACYTDEAWTVEDFRNRGIQRLLFLFKSRAAREEGKRWLITYYLHPSVVADAARNFARVGVDPPQKLCTVGYAHCAGFRFTWMHPETPLPERSALVFDHEP